MERTEPARRGAGGGPLPITGSRTGHLRDALSRAYDVLSFDWAAGHAEMGTNPGRDLQTRAFSVGQAGAIAGS